MKKKKLAIFVNSLARAGAEKVVFLLMKELRTEFEIHLLVFNARIIKFDVPEDIKIVQIGRPGDDGKLSGLLKIYFYARKVKKYLEQHDIPVLLSFLSRPNFTSGIVKMLGWKGKVIISERTMTSAYYNPRTIAGKTGRLLVKHLYRRADLIIVNSKLNQHDLARTFGIRTPIITIYNPIDIREVKDSAAEKAAGVQKRPGNFLFCNIGRYDYYKNHELLLYAFAKVKHPGVRLMIIGKDIPGKLSQLRSALRLEQKVQLIDVQQNVFPYLQAADAFVLSSTIEGFPNVLLEALASSLPVVSTDCLSGPREILAPGTEYPASMQSVESAEYGLLVKNGDAAMLADAMEMMASGNGLAAGYAAKAFPRAQSFDITIIVNEFRQAIYSFYQPETAAR